MPKLRVGVFALTSCSGCQFEMLELEELLELLNYIEFANWELVRERRSEGPFDAAFVEGAVTKPEEIALLKQVRERSKYLIAFGTCATFGGIPAMRNFFPQREIRAMIDETTATVLTTKASGVSEYVAVDYYLRGCPALKDELRAVFKALLRGTLPREKNYAVCVECREGENPCLLKKKLLCLGPITYAGCDALCPSNGVACYGCRGPFEAANVDAEVRLLKSHGFTMEDIRRAFIQFAGTSKKFKGFV